MAFDVLGLVRRIGHRAVQKGQELLYLQRILVPELLAQRRLLDQLISANLESVAYSATGPGLRTSGVSTSFKNLNTTGGIATPPSMRLWFDPSQYPSANLAKVRSIDIDYWIDADANGSLPEVALFNRSTGVEIAGSRVVHVGGTTSTNYSVANLPVGDGVDELPDERTHYLVKARDPGNLAAVSVLELRIIVRYVDPEV